MVPVGFHLGAEARVARHRPQFTGRRHERRRLALAQESIILRRESQGIVRHQLPHFTDRHTIRGIRQHGDRLEVAERRDLDHRARVEVVAHDHGDLMRPSSVDSRHSTALHGMIHRIVVDERGDM